MYVFNNFGNVMDFISKVTDSIYFGPYPNQTMIEQLIQKGFTTIVNLTTQGEEKGYECGVDVESISFPIKDRSVPESVVNYRKFIQNLYCIATTKEKKLYIHCRGGHGRSSMVTTSLVCYMLSGDLNGALDIVTKAHNTRVMMRNMWRSVDYPMNCHQLIYLHKNCSEALSMEILACVSGGSPPQQQMDLQQKKG